MKQEKSESKKVCAACHKTFPIEEFRLIKRKGRKPYRDSYCKECTRKYNTKYRRDWLKRKSYEYMEKDKDGGN